MGKFDYDLIVIGGGAAGLVSSKLAAGFGKKVALVERHLLGGECTHYGCIPSKTLISAARAAGVVKGAGRYGLRTGASCRVDTAGVMAHVRSVVEAVYRSHTPEAIAGLGIPVLAGEAVFRDSHHISVGDKTFSSDKFIIATGSSTLVPEIAGLGEVPFLTNESVFSLRQLPSSMIIIGGGPVGVELGSALSSLGVSVDLVHDQARVLHREDAELAEILSARLQQAGMRLHPGCTASAARSDGSGIAIDVRDGGRTFTLRADALLVAAGRKPNIGGLGLDHAGVRFTTQGIWTDRRLRTSVPNIYACGDVVGPYLFSHMAEYQAVTAVRNAFFPFQKKIDYENAAWCIFTDPELAHAGLTEEEARERYGDGIRVYRQAYGGTDRGRTDSADVGMSKFICHKGKLVGAHILGAHAGELIHEAQVVKSLGIPFRRLYEVIHIYPTFTDVVKHAAKLSYIDHLKDNPFLKILRKLL